MRAFVALRVEEGVAEHLLAGADAEHAAAAAHVRLQVDVPTLRAQELQVGSRRLAGGRDAEVCVEHVHGLEPALRGVGLGQSCPAVQVGRELAVVVRERGGRTTVAQARCCSKATREAMLRTTRSN